jgi:hypothetical protein
MVVGVQVSTANRWVEVKGMAINAVRPEQVLTVKYADHHILAAHVYVLGIFFWASSFGSSAFYLCIPGLHTIPSC